MGSGTADGAIPSCSSFFSTAVLINCYYASTETSCAPKYLGRGVVEVLAVSVMYAAKDLSLFPSGYTPGDVFSVNSPGTINSTGSTSTHTSVSIADSHHGLSVGAKIGIGLGVGLGFLLFSLGAFILFYRQKKQTKATAEKEEYNKAELEAKSKEPEELDGNATGELHGEDVQPRELEDTGHNFNNEPAELEA
jgi:hypothetical protein